MNILKREFKVNLKVFLFWILGLFFLIFAGMTKYTGLEGAAGGINVNDLLSEFPKVVLAVFGMVEIDISTLAGYYAIIAFYVMICGIIYALHLGTSAVSREIIDKTYEFIFTKPCSKKQILGMKVLAGWLAILGFAFMNLLLSYTALATLNTEDNINGLIILYSVAVLVVSSLFYVFGIFLSTVTKRAEKGILYGNLTFLFAFIMGVIYDMLENGKAIKWLSPLKYFEAKDLIEGKFDIVFLAFCIGIVGILMMISFQRFDRNDLQNS